MTLLIVACDTITLDPSMHAVEARDLTLISACETVPARGMSLCRFKENANIDSGLDVFLPINNNINGGELVLYYKDISKTYAITGKVTRIKFKDIIGKNVWEKNDNGIMLMLAQIRYEDDSGIERIVQARGEIRTLILPTEYDPLPLDSGFTAWEGEIKCRYGYSTSGRSAIQCK